MKKATIIILLFATSVCFKISAALPHNLKQSNVKLIKLLDALHFFSPKLQAVNLGLRKETIQVKKKLRTIGKNINTELLKQIGNISTMLQQLTIENFKTEKEEDFGEHSKQTTYIEMQKHKKQQELEEIKNEDRRYIKRLHQEIAEINLPLTQIIEYFQRTKMSTIKELFKKQRTLIEDTKKLYRNVKSYFVTPPHNVSFKLITTLVKNQRKEEKKLDVLAKRKQKRQKKPLEDLNELEKIIIQRVDYKLKEKADLLKKCPKQKCSELERKLAILRSALSTCKRQKDFILHRPDPQMQIKVKSRKQILKDLEELLINTEQLDLQITPLDIAEKILLNIKISKEQNEEIKELKQEMQDLKKERQPFSKMTDTQKKKQKHKEQAFLIKVINLNRTSSKL